MKHSSLPQMCKEKRREMGLTIQEVCQLTGYHNVAKFEKNLCEPRPKALRALIDFFSLPVDLPEGHEEEEEKAQEQITDGISTKEAALITGFSQRHIQGLAKAGVLKNTLDKKGGYLVSRACAMKLKSETLGSSHSISGLMQQVNRILDRVNDMHLDGELGKQILNRTACALTEVNKNLESVKAFDRFI